MMLQHRLHKKLFPILLGLVLTPAQAAVFSSGGSDNEPTPPKPSVFNTSPSSGSSGSGSGSARPTPNMQVPDVSKVPELSQDQLDQLNNIAKDIQQNPEKLKEVLSEFQKMQKDGAGSDDALIADLGGSGSTKDDISKMKDEIKNIRAAGTAGEKKAMEDQAFRLLLEKALPMSPDQIKLLRKLYDVTQQAVATPANSPPTPKSSSSVISLEPGQTPPVIRTSAGFVTSIVFTDSTGAPWPIVSYTLGNPSLFNIQWDQKSNTLFIQSLKTYAHGNLAVTLYDQTTPVMISMVSGQREVDFRTDFQIAGRGPEATAPIMTESLTDAKINPILINVLDGIPPKGSTKLGVSGNHGDAWLKGDTLYFRSKLVVLSPAWVGTISSPDGTHVYAMSHTPSILASKDGQTIDIRLTGI